MRLTRTLPLLALGLGLVLAVPPRPEADPYEFWWKNGSPSSGVHYIWGGGWARIWVNISQWSSSDIAHIAAAAGKWGSVTGADFHYELKTCPWDPSILSGWNNQNDVYVDTLGPGTLGLTMIQTTGSQFNETDVAIDPSVVSGIYGDDMESTVLHELGHCLGLAHEDDVPSVMNTYANGVQRNLHPDDQDGVRALYPPKTPITFDPGPDIAVVQVEHSPSLRLGAEVLVSWTFTNRGTVASNSFEAVVYLDGEKAPGPVTGTEMGRTTAAGLSPDKTESGSLRVLVPDVLLPGKWYLGVRAESVYGDRNATNNAAAPPRPLEITRPGIEIGPCDECRGTLGPYGIDKVTLDLPAGLMVKTKLTATGLDKKGNRRISAKLGVHRLGISAPFDWDFGRKIKLKTTTDQAGRHEIRVSNDRAVPLTYRLRVQVAGQTLEGLEQPGRSIPFQAWAGGSVSLLVKSGSFSPTLTLVDPDGDPVDLAGRLRVKSEGRKLKLKGFPLLKSGEYTLALGGSTAGYCDYWIEVAPPTSGAVIERD